MAYEDFIDEHYNYLKPSKSERVANKMRYNSPIYILDFFEELRTYFANQNEKDLVSKLDKVIESMNQ